LLRALSVCLVKETARWYDASLSMRTRSLLLAASALAVLCVSLFLATCTPRSSFVPSHTGGSASRPAGDGYWLASDHVVQERGEPSAELSVSGGFEPNFLDIHKTNSGGLIWFTRLFLDCLVYLDREGEPRPWLAESWTASPDRKKYTFRLRHGVSFSDGSPFDAQAVLANFDRVKGLWPQSAAAGAFLDGYESGRALDAHTLEISLREPNHAFVSYLAQAWAGLVSPVQVRDKPESIATWPIGTGPFVIKDIEPKKRVVLVRRDDYNWAPLAIKHQGRPYAARIVYNVVSDPQERAQRLTDGTDQLCFEVDPSTAESLRKSPTVVYSKRLRPGSPLRGFTFNTKRAPFDDVRVRRGVALAMDREAIVRNIGAGEFAPTSEFLGPNTSEYAAGLADVLQASPEKAAKLFDEAGWDARDAEGFRVARDGRRLSFELVATGKERTPSASVLIMQENLKRVGAELRIATVSNSELNARVAARDYDVITGGWWSARSPDILYLLYHSRHAPRQHGFGHDTANLGDPRLDALLQQARESDDPTRRKALYSEAQRLLTELVPIIPLHQSQALVAWRKELKGVLFDTTYNTPVLTAAWLPQGAQ